MSLNESFYKVAVAERNFERVRADRLAKERDHYKALANPKPEPFDTAPTDGTVILAWHQMWLCWMPVKYVSNTYQSTGNLNWAVAYYGSVWPKESFTHWIPMPDGPDEYYSGMKD